MFTLILVLTIVLLLGYNVYKWGTKNGDFFRERGVKFIEPLFIFGNMKKLVFKKTSFFDFLADIYNQYPNEKIIGFFDFRSPVVILRDPDIIKQLAVKEFDNFSDHRVIVDETMDTLFGNTLLALKGQKWRDMRATLSPAFTGSKMRLMFELVSDCSEQMVKYFKKEAEAKGPQSYEMKDIFSRLTNDVIATCAFGIKVDSLESQENQFYMTGKKIMNFTSPLKIVRFMGYKIFPHLMKLFKVPLIEKRLANFFYSLIIETMTIRDEKQIFRPDMINLLMEAKKGVLSHNADDKDSASAGFATVEESEIGRKIIKRDWSNDEIVAQCLLFFLAGFETSSTALNFTCYEIGTNPSVQAKLYEEMRDISELLEGEKLTYESLQKMKYLDMVISESLRKWPPGPLTDRICVKDFMLDDGQGLRYKFEKETNLWIPISGIHHDPKYFPNPEKFDPERFSDENKGNINLSAYLPFGVGPRNCIGSRFALMELKSILYHLILNFSLEITEQTQIPLKLSNNPSGMIPEQGVWFELRPRK